MQAKFRGRRDAFLDKIGKKPVIMGILNLTPDSFSDGGEFCGIDTALAHARAMVSEGCDIVDAGGESTRPGATPLSEAGERARIEPIIGALCEGIEMPVSIDTYKAAIAEIACLRGAVVVNDVWGLQKDPAMAATVAKREAAVVVMHNRAAKDETIDIVADMIRFFDISLKRAKDAGIPRERIIFDPGVGFGKTPRQQIEAIGAIGRLKTHYDLPVLIGVSRKSFLGALLDAQPQDRLTGTIAANLAAAAAGAGIFRVHDVAAHAAALKVFDLIRNAAPCAKAPIA